MSQYQRPTIDRDTAVDLAKVARKVNAIHDQNLRLVYILKLCVENAQLLLEVNDHRVARGLEPLTVFNPGEMAK